MFTLSSAAALRIRDSAGQSGATGMAIRVAAKLDERGELQFGLGFDEEREQDQSFEVEGLTVLIGPPSRELLADMVLDFVEVEPGDWQFVFFRTEAPGGGCGPSSCGGCGSRGCSSAS
jgi:iron-sulfur cluster assembly protein